MSPTTVTVAGPELAAALRAVRFAVGSDPELPVLGGVLLDVAADAVTLVATDRHRLAIASVPVLALDGPAVGAVVPAPFSDRFPAAGTVVITVDGPTIGVRAGAEELTGHLIPDAFPDYRRLVPGHDRAVPVDASLRAALTCAPTRTLRRDTDGVEYEVAVLGPGPDGIAVGADGEGVAVNREFLLEALDAGGDGQLLLSLDGPISPLVIRSPRSLSLLMPVRP